MNLLTENINRIKTLMNINEGEASFPSDEKQHLEKFVDFVKKELNIENDVNIRYQTDKDGIKTTAVYKYQDGGDEEFEQSEVRVYTKERALQDIMRSVAHELVHHQQNERGDLEGKISNVGGPIEDEANAVAGELLKKYGINHPEIYGGEESVDMEFTEQEEGGGETTDTSGDSSSTNANVSTWETGLSRGPANQITITIWSSDVNRGKGNPIDQNSKWETGLSRGKANPLT